MKQCFLFFLCFSLLFSTACSASEPLQVVTIAETSATDESDVTTAPTTDPTFAPETVTLPTEPEPIPGPVVTLTEEEKTMLLRLGMAERGYAGCTECIALVMCTVLNRVNTGWYSSIRSAIYAPEQFTPVMDGSFVSVKPSLLCYDALEMVLYGWDESQGALYYEWCTGESWHSKNRHLLFQHCDVRFYD